MKQLVAICLLLTQVINANIVSAQQAGFNRADFYSAMRTDSEAVVNNQLAHIKNAASADRAAFEGALLMKKAGLVGDQAKS